MNKEIEKIKFDEEVKNYILDLKIDGFSYEELHLKTLEKYPNIIVSYNVFFNYYLEVLNDLKRTTVNADDIITDHMIKYETLYKWLKEKGYNRDAIKCLQQKEKLLGLHEDNFELEINNEMEQEEQQYNLDNLTEQEQKRFEYLIKKSSIVK